MKHKCFKCKFAMATWYYVPCSESGEDESSDYWCDKCVNRGCSCQADEDGIDVLDGLGRRLPCIEYDEDPLGFDTNRYDKDYIDYDEEFDEKNK